MDTISKAKKLQTMKGYKNDQFLYNLIAHTLIALACSSLCFYYWFPTLRLSIKHFLFPSFPKMLSSFFSPKWLFVVVNVIVAYLVGESKLVASQSSSPTGEIYEEYVERSRAIKGDSSLQQEAENSELDSDIIVEKRVIKVFDQHKVAKECGEEVIELLPKKEDKELEEEEEEYEECEEDKEVVVEEENDKEKERDVEEENDKEKKRDVEEEEIGLPAEELNKRVEEFIARVNKQRWLEERLLICFKA